MNRQWLLFGAAAMLAVFIFTPGYAQVNWTEHNIDPSFDGAWGLTVIDMDGDSDIDIVSCGKDADEVAWYENDGSQNFVKHTIDANFRDAWCVDAIDIDGDTDIDVVGTAQGPSYVGLITWWENDGSMNFTPHSITSNYPYTAWVDAVDLDSDGDVDFVAVATWDDRIGWWENDGSENFTYSNIAPYFRYPYFVRAVDLDQDNDMDLLAGGAYEDASWFENDGSENFVVHEITDLVDSCFSPYMTAADMDGDGDLDVLVPDLWRDDVYYCENDGNQNFTTYFIDHNFDGVYCVEAADLDDDGDMDAVGAAWAADEIRWWENQGGYVFVQHTIASGLDYARLSLPVDLNQDGTFDVVGTAQRSDIVSWWEGTLVLPGSISGTVTDINTTDPVENVQVTVQGSAVEAFTDTGGNYDLADLDAGTYNIMFSHADYYDSTVSNVAVISGEVTTLDVQLTSSVSGYEYYPGDANMSTGQWPPLVIGGDVTYLVGYFRGINPNCIIGDPGIYCSADANGDCLVIGSDVTKLVSYFRGLTQLDYCPEYEPAWHTPDDFPAEAPMGWPGCQ